MELRGFGAGILAQNVLSFVILMSMFALSFGVVCLVFSRCKHCCFRLG